jgi:hypothetical protein
MKGSVQCVLLNCEKAVHVLNFSACGLITEAEEYYIYMHAFALHASIASKL